MGYSIGQVAKKTGLTAHTLRYYQKEGLLPFLQKSSSGLRVFSDNDLGWLGLIECLKETGMPLKDIRQYIDWYLEGDSTLSLRLDMFKNQKNRVEEQIRQFQKHLEKIEYKIALYEEAVKEGSLDKAVANPRMQALKNGLSQTDNAK
ncbi:MAG: MerR family transcriptional regulator [Alphaproteobacteria bacterium]|nr:MerR family transcriptional regulator [Alphaproteobacteria bacterium]